VMNSRRFIRSPRRRGRARCVEGRIARHQCAVANSAAPGASGAS
jgi:hypothetical protein